jgi:hypothetical protein
MAALTRGPVTPRSRASEELRRCFDAIGVNQKGDSRPRLPLESGTTWAGGCGMRKSYGILVSWKSLVSFGCGASVACK